MMPRVSVIIPSYNHAAYIQAAIESVLAQSYRDHEIIVVDDGSEDATHQVVMPYLSRISFYDFPNAGIAANYNRGIGLAKGRIVAFLESDDLLDPLYLERAMNVMENEPDIGGLIVGRRVLQSTRNGKDKLLEVMPKRSPGRFFTTESILVGGDWGIASTPILRLDCLEEVGLFDEQLAFGCDVDMALRFTLKYRLAYLDEPLYLYRRHRQNTTRDLVQTSREALRVALHFVERHPDYSRLNTSIVNRCIGNLYGRVGSLMLKSGDFPRSAILEHFRAAVSHYPSLKNYRRLILEIALPGSLFRRHIRKNLK
ncbi:MAG: glycosyltransferase [Acidobacteriota bacterium]